MTEWRREEKNAEKKEKGVEIRQAQFPALP
jgi:hypothetical protein